MIPIAKLAGNDLPEGFSYRPYVPPKRTSINRTARAVITQSSNPVVIEGDGTLPWNLPQAYPNEFQMLYDLYDTNGPVIYTFEGYWGEVLEVRFSVLDQPRVRGRLFNLSGTFQVVCTVTKPNAQCNW